MAELPPPPRDLRVRIFVSSPSDVRPERAIVERVIHRLGLEFTYHFRVEPVLWEREPLVAGEHFQSSLTPPSETDIVVVILWSQLGVPLPVEKFPGPLTKGQVTGTEWEFEDALAGYRRRGLPDLLFYRKTASVIASLDDADAVQRRLYQKVLVDEFVHRWFVSTGATTFTAAFREFQDGAQLEEMTATHLRELLVRRLDTLGAQRAPGGIRWHDGSPYRGLQAFELRHAPVFFGRMRARNELRELLARRADAGCAFVLVFGASGTGKSSLVRCGLLSDLSLPGMIGRVALCRYAVFRPSDAPDDPVSGLATALLGETALPELAGQGYDAVKVAALLHAPQYAVTPIETALAQAAAAAHLTNTGEARLLVVVDQLEELFTIDRIDAGVRDRFVAALDELARSGSVWVIATMRSDFFERVPGIPVLASLSSEAQYLLGFPDDAALAQIVQQPAMEAGLRFESGPDGVNLADVIQADAARSPNALPLLEFVLEQLWQRRTERGEMTFAAYHELGGLEGAIGQAAEQEFRKQPADIQAALPVVLRALATAASSSAVTARVASLAQFPRGTPARALIDALVSPEARLLVADGDGDGARVRVAHEALLTHWDRAHQQLETNRADLRTRARLETAAALWRDDTSPRRSTLLLNPGAPLAEAEDLLRRVPDTVDPGVKEFITASSTAARRSRRRLQLAAVSFAAIAVIAVVAARQAYVAAGLARSRELATDSAQQLDTSPELALLLATAAFDARETPQAEAALRDALPRVPRLVITGHRDRVFTVAFSGDGRSIVTASGDGDARIFDVTTGRSERVLSPHAGPVRAAVFTGDSERVLTAGEDGVVRVWDATSGAQIRELHGHAGPIYSIAVAPSADVAVSGGDDGVVRVWRLADGSSRLIDPWTSSPSRGAVNRVAFSPDGMRVLAAGENGDAVIAAVADGRTVDTIRHAAWVVSAAFSPDGQQVATASGEFAVVSRSGTSRKVPCGGDCGGVAFDPAGDLLAVGSKSGRTHIYRIDRDSTLTLGRELIGHTGFVRSVAFGRGGLIATAGDDGTVRIWGPVGPVQTFAEHPSEVANAAFSADGRLVATASAGRVSVWDAATGQRHHTFTADTVNVIAAVFSPDGRLIVTGGESGATGIWTSNGSPYRELPRQNAAVNSAAFSVDSTRIVTAGKDGHVRLFDARSGASIWDVPGHAGEAFAASFSPDGRLVGSGHADGAFYLWNATDGAAIRHGPARGAPIYGVAFGRGVTTMATASLDGAVRLWDASTLTERRAFTHANQALSVEFDSTGTFVITAGGTSVDVRDVETGNLVMTVTPGGAVRAAAFRPDGRALVTAGVDGTAKIFVCDVCVRGPELRSVARQRLTRDFTGEERARYPGVASGFWP